MKKIIKFFVFISLIPKYWGGLKHKISSDPKMIEICKKQIKNQLKLSHLDYKSQLPFEARKKIIDELLNK